jgi:GMP reductase
MSGPLYFKPTCKNVSPVKLDFKDVLITPKTFSHIRTRKEVCDKVRYHFKSSNRTWKGVPIFASNMDSIGTLKMYGKLHEHEVVTCFHKNLNKKLLENDYDLDKNLYSISTGINTDDIEILKEVMDKYKPKFLCIDVANGYMMKFLNTVNCLKSMYPDTIIIAGNIVTPEILPELSIAGIDIIKLGIGSGSVCTTRIKTGIGYPQLSSILDCYETAQKYDIKIMSDGGIQTPGDICKAYAAGADFVMLGSMFAGHKDTSEQIINSNGCEYAEFYGMSSQKANNIYNGGLQNYKTAEGKRVMVKLKDSVDDTVEDILGGIRSCCAYVGAWNPSEIYQKSNIIRVQHQVNDQYL